MRGHDFEAIVRSLDTDASEVQREAVDRHVRECGTCRVFLGELRETERLLRRPVALTATPPLALSSIHGAATSSIRGGVSVALASIVLVLLAVLVGSGLAAYRQTPVSVVASSPSASPSPSSAVVCPLPAAAPTYLPFTSSPPVEYSYASGRGRRYNGTDERTQLPVYFSIERDTRPVAWAGQGRRVVAGTRMIELLWIGDPSIGAVAARWNEGEGACTEEVAFLVLHTGTQAEIEAELIRVVGSLRP